MHSTYRDLMQASVQGAVARARACSGVEHPVLEGTLREIVVGDLLRPMLPADLGIGTGTVIAHDGRTSRQHDIVLYDRSILPPFLFEGGCGLFPIESVAYTIEIKSTLDRAGLREAHDAAVELLLFPYASGQYDSNDKPDRHDFTKAISAVFAFQTDVKKGRDLERYQELLSGDAPAIKSICVVGSGFWDHQGSWVPFGAKNLNEIVQFIAQIGNSFRRVLDSRGRPRIGMYVR